MGDYLVPLLFLVAVFVAFGLVHGNRRGGNCHGCDGECDKTSCDKP